MTLNLLFFTVTFHTNQLSVEECIQEQEAKKLRDQYINKGLIHRNL
ncbi:YrzI family small protein [Peribacillus sp. SCS-155]